MIGVSEELHKALNKEVTYFAGILRITLKNKQILCLTDCDKDIFLDNEIYRSDSGFSPSAIDSSSNLDIDNFQIELVIDNESIKKEDVENNLFDYADIDIFLIDYENPSFGKIHLKSGNTISRI